MRTLTLQDVADLANVQRPVVSMWRNRPRVRGQLVPFPDAVSQAGGIARFDPREVVDYLRRTGRGNNSDVEYDVAAIAVYTTRGGTPAVLAQHRLAMPILALASSQRIVRQMALLFGIHPALMAEPTDPGEILEAAAKQLEAAGLATKGQKIVIVVGLPFGSPEGTNTMVVRTIE